MQRATATMKHSSTQTARFASIESHDNITQSNVKAGGSNGGRIVVPTISKRDRFELSHPLLLLPTAKGQSSEAVYVYAMQQPITVTRSPHAPLTSMVCLHRGECLRRSDTAVCASAAHSGACGPRQLAAPRRGRRELTTARPS